MSAQIEYRIYCITEGTWVSTWATTPPTQCPNDPAHTVNPDSVQELTTSTTEIETSVSADPSFMTKILSTQTSDVTIALPNSNDTLVGLSTAQTLTNKTILGASNTVEATHFRGQPVSASTPTQGQFLTFNGSQWSYQDPADSHTTAFLFDDFIGNEVKPIWSIVESGVDSSINIIDGVGGQVQLESGSIISNHVDLSSGTRIVNTASNSIITFRIKLSHLTNTLVRIGVCDTSSEVIDFIFDTSSSPNWHSRTITGGADTTNDTTIAATTNWTKFQINLSTANVQFYIDDTLQQTHITNIPSGLLKICVYQESLSATQRHTIVDYIQLSGERESSAGTSSVSCTIL